MTSIIDQNTLEKPVVWHPPFRDSVSSEYIPHQWNDDESGMWIGFSIEPYTSDLEDYFGVNLVKYKLLAHVECNFWDRGYKTDTHYELGDDFCDREDAQVYTQYVLKTWQRYGNFRCCPVCNHAEED